MGTSKQARCPWKKVPSAHQKTSGASTAAARDRVVDAIGSELPGVTCRMPGGAFYVFPNVSRIASDDIALANHLLNEGGVAVLGGSTFGPHGKGFLRLSYANSEANLRAALDRKPDQRLTPAPIEASRLGELYMAIMTGGGRPARLTEGFRVMVDVALAARMDETARARSAGFVASCLSVLEEDLAELDPRAIDPRFLRSRLIRRGLALNHI